VLANESSCGHPKTRPRWRRQIAGSRAAMLWCHAMTAARPAHARAHTRTHTARAHMETIGHSRVICLSSRRRHWQDCKRAAIVASCFLADSTPVTSSLVVNLNVVRQLL
jgi:hypothetical protein